MDRSSAPSANHPLLFPSLGSGLPNLLHDEGCGKAKDQDLSPNYCHQPGVRTPGLVDNVLSASAAGS